MNSDFKLIDFLSFGNKDGLLTPLESNKNIPFDIKRVYYIYDTKSNVTRGMHAHKDLQQVIICVNGECKISCECKNKKQTFNLKNKNQGLYIKNLVWRKMFDFSSDCVLLVLASHFYNPNDYIKDYNEFLDYDNKG